MKKWVVENIQRKLGKCVSICYLVSYACFMNFHRLVYLEMISLVYSRLIVFTYCFVNKKRQLMTLRECQLGFEEKKMHKETFYT